jgi:hypothetical protein
MRRTLLAAVLLAACRKESTAGTGARPASSADAREDAPPGTKAALLGARCHPTGQGALVDQGEGAGELEIGDAVAHAGGYAVGILHQASGGRVAAVVLVGADAGGARVVDLGPTLGDGAPPRLAACHGTLVAAAFGLPRAAPHGSASDPTRDLVFYDVDSTTPNRVAASIAQQRDESLAFDIACSEARGLAVWDETAPASLGARPRGVVRAASFDAAGSARAAHDVSPPESDAEMPRVVSDGSGFLVLWIAHRPEGSASSPEASAGSAGQGGSVRAPSAAEATGEARSHGWVEMIALDASGGASGPLRQLTPTSGHVSAYDVTQPFGGANRTLFVVARDDQDRGDGAGGRLLSVRVRGDALDRPTALPTDGLGLGPPTFVDGADSASETEAHASWIAWVGPRDELRLLPLDAVGETVFTPSAEDALDEARPLRWVAGERRMLVAVPFDRSAQLRIFACSR